MVLDCRTGVRGSLSCEREISMFFEKRPAEPVKTEKIIGYKYSATGIFGYAFYCGGQKICTAISCTVPSSAVWIQGYGIRWKSGFDKESTLVPGLTTRYVFDDANAQVARLVYKSSGEYEIAEAVLVRCGEISYSFFRDGEVIAQISRCEEKNIWKPASIGDDCEPWFAVDWEQELNPALRLLILSFPMLRFGF